MLQCFDETLQNSTFSTLLCFPKITTAPHLLQDHLRCGRSVGHPREGQAAQVDQTFLFIYQ